MAKARTWTVWSPEACCNDQACGCHETYDDFWFPEGAAARFRENYDSQGDGVDVDRVLLVHVLSDKGETLDFEVSAEVTVSYNAKQVAG